MTKIKITQATSKTGSNYLIHQFNDGNPLPSFEIYKLVKNCKEVAGEFEINDTEIGRDTQLNTREMCCKMIDKINKENLYTEL